jgi:hypothetical protein
MPTPAAPESVPTAPGELFCPECGYDLRGIEGSARCPECGMAIDRSGAAGSRIGWVHRRRVGRLRAYVKTVGQVLFHAGRVGAEAAVRPIDYAAAHRFRWVTVAWVSLPPAVAYVIAWSSVVTPPWVIGFPFPASLSGAFPAPVPAVYDFVFPWAAGAMTWYVPPVALVLLAALVTGVASYWFHPRRLPVVRQNRAVAVSYYGCAPLAWLPVGLLLVGAAVVLAVSQRNNFPPTPLAEIITVLTIFGAIGTVGPVIGAWGATLRLYRAAVRPGPGGFAAAAAGITAAWVACAVLALGLFPWAAGYVRLAVESFRP